MVWSFSDCIPGMTSIVYTISLVSVHVFSEIASRPLTRSAYVHCFGFVRGAVRRGCSKWRVARRFHWDCLRGSHGASPGSVRGGLIDRGFRTFLAVGYYVLGARAFCARGRAGCWARGPAAVGRAGAAGTRALRARRCADARRAGTLCSQARGRCTCGHPRSAYARKPSTHDAAQARRTQARRKHIAILRRDLPRLSSPTPSRASPSSPPQRRSSSSGSARTTSPCTPRTWRGSCPAS